jgi:hypothetical protein
MEITMKRILLSILVITQILSISTVGAVAVDPAKEKASYRAQNDVLYYGECGGVGQSAAAGVSTAGCGEKGSGIGCNGTKTQSEANKKEVWAYLKQKGLSDTAAAGVMGNMDQESCGFMPDANNGNNVANGGAKGGGCRGLVQWCGTRNDSMNDFADKQGKPWDCLSTQLDFVWYEVTETGEGKVMDDMAKATTPSEAANIWAIQYERPKLSEIAGRAERAEKIFTEFNGTAGGSTQVLNDASSGDSGGNVTVNGTCGSGDTTATTGPGSLPDGECSELIERVKKLEADGKIVLQNKAPEEDDVNHCGQVTTCPSSGHGGVDKHVLQVLIAMAEQSGQVVQIYAFNKDHSCDNGEHGKGLGMDVSWPSSSPQGQAIYKYLFDNASTLGINKLIYNLPAAGDGACMYAGKPISCKATYGEVLGEHASHIHVSL